MINNMTLPLEGLRVVDFTTVVAAPTAGELLCAFGADVIKVEAIGGEAHRTTGSFLGTPYKTECNPHYTLQNSNKKHISIDLKSEEGSRVMMSLIDKADIFLSNVREPALERLGLDYDTLSAKYPRLIYAHFSGYGPKGPNAGEPGFDSTVFWLRGGMIADWQTEDARYPFEPTYAFGDTATASSFFSAVLLAVIGREKTGKGTKVESSLYSSAIWCNGQGVLQTQFEKKKLNPEPEKVINPQNGYYKCSDGKWFSLNERTYYEKDLPAIAKALGLDDVLSDKRYESRESLEESGVYVEYRERITEAFKTKPAAEWKKIFKEYNMPCDVAVRTADVAGDEQALANGYLEEVTYPDGTKVMMPVPPMFLSNYARRPIVPTGEPGDATSEILKTIGYTEDMIAELRNIKAVK